MYMPYGTSLRMGRLGYQSDAQASLAVSYNSLEGYGASLQDALTRPYPAYEAIGIKNPGGDYNQLARRYSKSKTSSTARFAPSASSNRMSVITRCANVAWNTLKCGSWILIRLCQSELRRQRCALSTCSSCTVCSPTARQTLRQKSQRSDGISTAPRPADASRGSCWSATEKTSR